MRIHFIAGLPRSGSTLLSAILRQNPRFHAGMTSPVATIYKALETSMSRRNEAAMFITEAHRQCVLHGLFESYYAGIKDHQLVFDTNRAWCSKLPALALMFPAARIICCVRDVGWIMDSIERLVRANAFELSGMFGYNPNTTVFSRINKLAAGDGFVGYALDALKEAFFGDHSYKLILVEYNMLAMDPRGTIENLYLQLEEPLFQHDFHNVEYTAHDFDEALGTPGLHTVRPRVEFVERKTILPPELFKRFENDAFWRN